LRIKPNFFYLGSFLDLLKTTYKLPEGKNVRLILAGGYDPRLAENIEHFEELTEIVDELRLSPGDIKLLKSPSDEEKVKLLKTSQALIYTPSGNSKYTFPRL